MSTSPTQHDKLQHLFNQIATELVLAKPGKDDGLLPIYSLLGDVADASDAPEEIQQSAKNVRSSLDKLLDSALPFDDATLAYLNRFTTWFQESLNFLNAHKPIILFPVITASTFDVKNTSTTPKHNQPTDSLLVVKIDDDREIFEEFYNEAQEHLEQIESVLLTLEQDPRNAASLSALFRSFHTIKGVSGFLHLTPIQSLAHEIESLLDLARNHKLVLNSQMITTILKSKDAIALLVGQVAEMLNKGSIPQKIIPVSHLILEARAEAKGEAVVSEPVNTNATDTAHDTNNPPHHPSPAEPPPTATHETPSTQESNTGGKRNAPASKSSSIRVNTEKLDNLMDTVGELVITQSQLLESAKAFANDNSPLQRNLAQLTRISKELQHTSMSLRMVPIGTTFQKMERIARDVSSNLSKKVTFTTSGEDTELDRNVVELISDPLVHMVRNAVDHGIEDAAGRKAAGKDAYGQVELNAYHMGGSIIIDLKDDGRGLDPAKLLDKARSKGLVKPGQSFTNDEIFQFIFLPGFSTATVVTDVSGRGVGMDVVRQNIESLRGQVLINSQLGHGSTFTIKLPLTTAIIDGLLVRVGSDRFIIPTLSVKVALRPESYQIKTLQNNVEVLNLRQQSIPILRLHQKFNIPNAVTDATNGIVVILETLGRPFALLVDAMIGKQEVVIKSLGNALNNLPGIAGGAILGDGNIALILDPTTLVGK